MKNIIEYYYHIKIDKLYSRDDYYYFNINNNNYIFKVYNDNEKKSYDIYRLNTSINNNIPVDRIILNIYNSPITKVKDKFYILLLKKQMNNISLRTITNMANRSNIESLERNNWELLWENKIDHYEEFIGQNEKKYPLIRESLDYFIGLTENAIAYLVNTKIDNNKENSDYKVISHSSLFDNVTDPNNIILDHRSRDVAEYIKISFFNNNQEIFKELDEYLYYNYYSLYGIKVLYARVLYPSFYFSFCDEIIEGKRKENDLNIIINRIDNYQKYLYQIYLYLNKFYNIEGVEWLKSS